MKDIIESDSAHKAANERLLPRARRRRTLKQQDFLFDRLRVRDLSELARLRHPDGHGDYVLPDTPAGRHLALAIITHWLRRPGERGKWLFQFCHDSHRGLIRMRSTSHSCGRARLRNLAASCSPPLQNAHSCTSPPSRHVTSPQNRGPPQKPEAPTGT